MEERARDKMMPFMSVPQPRTLRKTDVPNWKQNLTRTFLQFHILFLQWMGLVNIETVKHRNIEYPELEGIHWDNQSVTPVPSQDSPKNPLNLPESAVHTFLELWQAWHSCFKSNLNLRVENVILEERKG